MLDFAPELRPALIGLQIGIAGCRVELIADAVERSHACVAAARQVDTCEVQWQTKEVVAERPGDEFVDAVGHLPRCAAHDLGRGFAVGAAFCISERVEESVDEASC